MDFRHLLIILSAISLVECTTDESVTAETVDNPIKDTEHTPTLKESNNNGTNLEKTFYHAVIEKLTALSDEPINLAIKLIKDTYADKPENEHVNQFLTRVLEDHQDSINPESSILKIEFFLRLSLVLDWISGPIQDDWEKGSIALKEALEKYDVHSISIELLKTYNEFLEWLISEIDAYSKESKLDWQLQLNEFKQLCQQYKNEQNFENRSRVLRNIVKKLDEWSLSK